MPIKICFEVEYCIDDCPFSSFFEETKQWYCSYMIGSPVNASYSIIVRGEDTPPRYCPFNREE
jgi:hypothetical protein